MNLQNLSSPKKKVTTEKFSLPKDKKITKQDTKEVADVFSLCEKIDATNGGDDLTRESLQKLVTTRYIPIDRKYRIAQTLHKLISSTEPKLITFVCSLIPSLLDSDTPEEQLGELQKLNVHISLLNFLENSSEEVVSSALEGLGSLLQSSVTLVKKMVAEDQILQKLVNAIKKYPNNQKIKENGYWALSNAIGPLVSAEKAIFYSSGILTEAIDYVIDNEISDLWLESLWLVVQSTKPEIDSQENVDSFVLDGGMTALAVGLKKLTASSTSDEETLQSVVERINAFFASRRMKKEDEKGVREELKSSIYEEVKTINETKSGTLQTAALDLMDICDGLLYGDNPDLF